MEMKVNAVAELNMLCHFSLSAFVEMEIVKDFLVDRSLTWTLQNIHEALMVSLNWNTNRGWESWIMKAQVVANWLT